MMAGVPLAAGIGAGANLIGGLFQNSAAQQSVLQQEQFQEKESDTAWQRSVQGMEAAGLNPALAYSQGPASSPNGSTYQPTNVIGDAVQGGIGAASTAGQLITQSQQLENLKSENDQTKANTAKAIADTAVSVNSAKKIQADTEITKSNIPQAHSTGEMYSKYPWLVYVDKALQAVGGTASVAAEMAGAGAGAKYLLSSSPSSKYQNGIAKK